jgi:hypothetical protein
VTQGSCVSDASQCAADADCVEIANCYDLCLPIADDDEFLACAQECVDAYPDSADTFLDYLECLNTECSAACA